MRAKRAKKVSRTLGKERCLKNNSKRIEKSWLLEIENERRSEIGLDVFNSFEEMIFIQL